MSVTSDGENVSAEDCRTCLLQLSSKLPDTGLTPETGT